MRTSICTALLVLALGSTAQAGERIVGGGPAAPGDYPWTVALIDATFTNAADGQFCGGTLINPTLVLTAAHCVEGAVATDIDVLAGQQRLSATDGERLKLTGIAVHPAYKPETAEKDVALLRLERASVAQPIGLIEPGEASFAEPGDTAAVTGWGALHEEAPYAPDQLHFVEVDLVSDTDCEAAYGRALKPDVMLCAGVAGGGKDSCYGDSGGPLMVQNGGGVLKLVGVVSWGEGCAQAGFPGVYADVTALRAFIDSEPVWPPYPTRPPRLTGDPSVGSGLGCEAGAWANEPEAGATYTWLRVIEDPPFGSFSEVIEGATTSSYVAADQDTGSKLACVETRKNAGGSGSSFSNVVGPVVFVPPPFPQEPTGPFPGGPSGPESFGDRKGPRLVRDKASCKKAACTVSVIALDGESGVLSVNARVTYRRKGKLVSKLVRLESGPDGAYLLTLGKLPKGRLTVTLSAVDREGNLSARSLRHRLRVR